MSLGRFGLLMMLGTSAFVTASHAYAQSDINSYESGSIAGDIADNPLAQEILQKIEQTKQWIAELEQRDYERLQEQEEMDERRQQALAKLSQDLAEWEKLWEHYSPRSSFGRFIDKIPDLRAQEVFWDQFGFKEKRVEAGREAFKKTIVEGGSRHDALQAYMAAAETKRIELIETNSQFNVRQGLAYYGQQALFDEEGRFVDSPSAGKQLRKYYEDYRTNPDYLAANPDDSASREDLSRAIPNTQCRDGHTAIHRFHADDFICTTMETAEMWIRLGMGEIVGQSSAYRPGNQLVNPLTRCDGGFSLILVTNTGKYSCTLADTASRWIGEGLAEIPDPEEFIRNSIEKKEARRLAAEINDQILKILDGLDSERAGIREEYDQRQADSAELSRANEREMTSHYSEHLGMSMEELSDRILQIRESLEDDREKIQRDQAREMKSLERQYQEKLESLVQEYAAEPYLEIIQHGRLSYEFVVPD